MRKVIFSLLAVIGVATAQADDYTYPFLTIETSSGATSISTASLTLTISDGKLIAANETTTQTFSLTELSKMYFSTSSATGIETIEAATTVAGREVYDLQGRRVDNPGKGVFIIKENGQTRKVLLK